ncbi:MAG: beta-ketoacyl-[acyl-carrier-protein] synthase family protein [Spirochaetes bacterium]|nr:beta-ketoacyl-[acyl-carrier-protein] synthase family protein [Spirochaetota bacterium]
MTNRVVVTGMGVVAPNANGLAEYEKALRDGISGIRFVELLAELNFGCQVGGIPQNTEILKEDYFPSEDLLAMNSSMIYSGIAGFDCWRDAGMPEITPDSEVDWETGAIIGTGIGGVDTIATLIAKTDKGKVKRLGSTMVEQTMCSAVSAKLGGFFGLGGQVTTNSSACTTGTEAIIEAFFKVKNGQCKRMLAGGVEGSCHYVWAGFDGMKVLNSKFNDQPEKASRPMSASAFGFIPGSGSGILMLESLDSALERGAKIYAEIGGGHVNCGGQRSGGSMTAPNAQGVVHCIQSAMKMADISAADIDAINGHLTATFADPKEIVNWQNALGITADQLPLVNSTKSLIGHALGGAGGLECVAAVLQLYKGFIHGSVNCEDLHPELEPYADSIVHQTIEKDINVIAKSSFGFGDVNGCLILKKYQ